MDLKGCFKSDYNVCAIADYMNLDLCTDMKKCENILFEHFKLCCLAVFGHSRASDP